MLLLHSEKPAVDGVRAHVAQRFGHKSLVIGTDGTDRQQPLIPQTFSNRIIGNIILVQSQRYPSRPLPLIVIQPSVDTI